jgi:hypothetical protein
MMEPTKMMQFICWLMRWNIIYLTEKEIRFTRRKRYECDLCKGRCCGHQEAHP